MPTTLQLNLFNHCPTTNHKITIKARQINPLGPGPLGLKCAVLEPEIFKDVKMNCAGGQIYATAIAYPTKGPVKNVTISGIIEVICGEYCKR